MLDISPHLLEPLYVDTNINYDLDMSKFPGLDDPQHMYQPALLIAADWSNYVDDDTTNHDVNDVNMNDDSFDYDLYSLIESCPSILPEDLTNSLDASTFQAILDDVISDTSLDDMELSDVAMDTDTSSDTSDDILHLLSCMGDLTRACGCPSVSALSPPTDSLENHPHCDEDLTDAWGCLLDAHLPIPNDNKCSAMIPKDVAPLYLPSLVSVCPTSGNSTSYRGS